MGGAWGWSWIAAGFARRACVLCCASVLPHLLPPPLPVRVQPKALLGAAAVAVSMYRSLGLALRRQQAEAAAGAAGSEGRGRQPPLAQQRAQQQQQQRTDPNESAVTAATTVVTWLLVAYTRCLPMLLLGATASLVAVLVHCALRRAPSESRHKGRQPLGYSWRQVLGRGEHRRGKRDGARPACVSCKQPGLFAEGGPPCVLFPLPAGVLPWQRVGFLLFDSWACPFFFVGWPRGPPASPTSAPCRSGTRRGRPTRAVPGGSRSTEGSSGVAGSLRSGAAALPGAHAGGGGAPPRVALALISAAALESCRALCTAAAHDGQGALSTRLHCKHMQQPRAATRHSQSGHPQFNQPAWTHGPTRGPWIQSVLRQFHRACCAVRSGIGGEAAQRCWPPAAPKT